MTPIPLGILDFPTGAAGAYDLLETQILTSSAASVTFTGLGSYTDYKHLQIRATSRQDTAVSIARHYITFNGDTGSNYAIHQLYGNGSSVGSSATAPYPRIQWYGDSVGTSTATNVFAASIIDILNFSDTSKNTTVRCLMGVANPNQINFASGLWNSTNAVTSIDIAGQGANLVAGSRFSLYGVK